MKASKRVALERAGWTVGSAEDFLALSPDERARLADVLLESLRDAPLTEIEATWDREI